MRKLSTMILATALAVAMVMPVFAASSPSGSKHHSKPAAASSTVTAEMKEADKTAPSTSVTVAAKDTSVEVLRTDIKQEVTNVTSTPSVMKDLGVNESAKLVSSFDLQYKGTIPAGGVVIPIKVNNAKAGDYAYVLHRKDDVPGYPWEVVGQGVLGADLTVNGTFLSCSPVAVMVVDAASVAATPVKAPKTGEF